MFDYYLQDKNHGLLCLWREEAKRQRERQCEPISIMRNECFDKIIVIYSEKLQYN